MPYVGESYTIKHPFTDDAGASITPDAPVNIIIRKPDGSETNSAVATVNANTVEYTYTPQQVGTFGYTITDNNGLINTGFFNASSKKGLTPKALSVVDELTVRVSVDVDEYLEKASDVNDVAIPTGDIPAYLDEAAREVIRKIDRITALDLAQLAINPFAVNDTNKRQSIIPLPENFYRFFSLKLSSFNQPVTEFVPDNSSAYRLQQYAHRRGTPNRPFVSLIPYQKDYNAETVPTGFAYATIDKHPSKGEYITLQDPVTGGGGNGFVHDISDPEFVILEAVDPFTIGSILTITGKNYTLKAKYAAGDTVKRTAFGKALEAYPSGSVEELFYIPYMRSWEIPDVLQPPVIKYASYKVFLAMRRFEEAKAALQDFALLIDSFNSGQKGEASVNQ